MRPAVLGFALLLAAGPAWARPDDKPDAKGLSPGEEVQKLISDYQKAQSDFYGKLREAKTAEERTKLLADGQPRPDQAAARLLELAEKNPTDKDVNPKALIWVVANAGYDADARKAKDKALGLLTRDHAGSDEVGNLCMALTREPSDAAEKFLRAAAEANSSNAVKGKAVLALGEYLKNTAEMVRQLKQDPDLAKNLAPAWGQDVVDRLAAADADQMSADAEKQLETAADKFADAPVYRTTVGELARGELFELRNLAIGKVAPEIEADDLDGKSFKLSDYRGKVVVIDFWGNW